MRQLAAGLDVELDSVEEVHERLPAPERFEIDAGWGGGGDLRGARFELRGMRGGGR